MVDVTTTLSDEQRSYVDNINKHFKSTSDLSNLLYPLLHFLKWQGHFRTLIETLPHFADKLLLTDFRNTLAQLNFNTETHKTNLAQIKQKWLPCLFIPKNGVAYLILNVTGDTLNILTDQLELTSKKPPKHEAGTLLYCSNFSEPKKTNVEKIWFYNMMAKYKILLLQVFLITLLYNICMVSVPIYIMLIYDRVLPIHSTSMLMGFSIGIILLIIAMSLFNLLRAKTIAYIGARLEKSVGFVIIRHIMYLSPSYTENTSIGNQMARIKDFSSIQDFLTSPIAVTLLETPTTIIFLLAIFLLGGTLGLIPIGLTLIFFLLYTTTNPTINEAIKNKASEQAKNQSFLLESLENLRDIKILGKTHIWKTRFKHFATTAAKSTFEVSLLSTILNAVSDFFMMFSALLVLFFGAKFAVAGKISSGTLIAIMLLTWKILHPIKSFFAYLPKLDQIKDSIQQVNNLIQIQTEHQEIKNDLQISHEPANIEFSRISFRYQANSPAAVLGISFIARPREIICITGNNGSGKSTLLRLLLAMYQPQTGNILINNKNIKQLTPITLRQAIGYMPQYNKLFYGTILQNLLFSNPEATKYDIEVAARLANVHEEIKQLSDGYNTPVGDLSRLSSSASFTQRLILARTLLSKSSILIFDEPENSLDMVCDQLFMEVILWLKKSKTILMVTHRPSHLSQADQIINLHKGQITHIGTPSEVLPVILGT